jgi:hypothetical protein
MRVEGVADCLRAAPANCRRALADCLQAAADWLRALLVDWLRAPTRDCLGAAPAAVVQPLRRRTGARREDEAVADTGLLSVERGGWLPAAFCAGLVEAA